MSNYFGPTSAPNISARAQMKLRRAGTSNEQQQSTNSITSNNSVSARMGLMLPNQIQKIDFPKEIEKTYNTNFRISIEPYYLTENIQKDLIRQQEISFNITLGVSVTNAKIIKKNDLILKGGTIVGELYKTTSDNITGRFISTGNGSKSITVPKDIFIYDNNEYNPEVSLSWNYTTVAPTPDFSSNIQNLYIGQPYKTNCSDVSFTLFTKTLWKSPPLSLDYLDNASFDNVGGKIDVSFIKEDQYCVSFISDFSDTNLYNLQQDLSYTNNGKQEIRMKPNQYTDLMHNYNAEQKIVWYIDNQHPRINNITITPQYLNNSNHRKDGDNIYLKQNDNIHFEIEFDEDVSFTNVKDSSLNIGFSLNSVGKDISSNNTGSFKKLTGTYTIQSSDENNKVLSLENITYNSTSKIVDSKSKGRDGYGNSLLMLGLADNIYLPFKDISYNKYKSEDKSFNLIIDTINPQLLKIETSTAANTYNNTTKINCVLKFSENIRLINNVYADISYVGTPTLSPKQFVFTPAEQKYILRDNIETNQSFEGSYNKLEISAVHLQDIFSIIDRASNPVVTKDSSKNIQFDLTNDGFRNVSIYIDNYPPIFKMSNMTNQTQVSDLSRIILSFDDVVSHVTSPNAGFIEFYGTTLEKDGSYKPFSENIYSDNTSNVTYEKKKVIIDVSMNPYSKRNLLNNSMYYVKIHDNFVKDLRNQPYKSTIKSFDFSFSTKDNISPKISKYSPLNKGTLLTVSDNIKFTFSEDISAGNNKYIWLGPSGENWSASNQKDGQLGENIFKMDVNDSNRITINNNLLTIDPSKNLVSDKSYNLIIEANAIMDKYDNYFIGPAPLTICGEYYFSTS